MGGLVAGTMAEVGLVGAKVIDESMDAGASGGLRGPKEEPDVKGLERELTVMSVEPFDETDSVGVWAGGGAKVPSGRLGDEEEAGAPATAAIFGIGTGGASSRR